MKSPALASLAKSALILGCLTLLAPCTPADPPKAGGKHKFTNRLAKETSPYLLMHAHNPTDWHPWGPEAFAKAKKENKLVFLSIGYSSCYWCHVMERESFNNEAVAKILNKHFVSIKVDREARPDIDQIYMTALTLIQRGGGGWPLSMFLTPDGKPVVGFTYRPAEDKKFEDGSVQTGFKSILKIVQNAWEKDRKALVKQADDVAAATKKSLRTSGFALIKLDPKILGDVVGTLKDNFDTVYGGFGSPQRLFRGPKFPTPPRLQFLLQRYGHTKNPEELAMVTKTLDTMALGGIYDHLGGGFHRYSTERTWTVPHFEKMLYDNGQLLEVYAEAYRLTKKPLYRRILQETIAYTEREMLSPEGAFYSSQDAETHEEEGRSYVWTDKEIDAVFTDKKDNAFVRKVYGADGKPNFEGKYHILTLAKPFAELAKDMKMTPQEFQKRLLPLRDKMFVTRNMRDQPFKNKIALTSWSGLMIAGLAEAGQVLGKKQYLNLATKAADFILKTQKTKDGKLLRTYGAQPGKKPFPQGKAYLDDYAFLVHGLLNLHDATGDKRWLNEAKKLTDAMMEQFKDKEVGGFYYTSHDSEKLFARSKDQYDGATPSGNSVAARNMVRLWHKTGDKRYADEAERSFKLFVASFTDSPTAMTTMAEALDLWFQLKK